MAVNPITIGVGIKALEAAAAAVVFVGSAILVAAGINEAADKVLNKGEEESKEFPQSETIPDACSTCGGGGGGNGDGNDPKKKKKASNSKPGEKVRTPETHKGDFSKNRSGQYKNKHTGEIWEKSHTRHSGGPEWKVGSKPGASPRPGSKVTVRGGNGSDAGRIIKID